MLIVIRTATTQIKLKCAWPKVHYGSVLSHPIHGLHTLCYETVDIFQHDLLIHLQRIEPALAPATRQVKDHKHPQHTRIYICISLHVRMCSPLPPFRAPPLLLIIFDGCPTVAERRNLDHALSIQSCRPWFFMNIHGVPWAQTQKIRHK